MVGQPEIKQAAPGSAGIELSGFWIDVLSLEVSLSYLYRSQYRAQMEIPMPRSTAMSEVQSSFDPANFLE
jgi:hypothetical protein